tara:strand:+ start:276 stop:1352 length:1077 start_codon:yes stop_codon:yes gene_type:complete
MAYVGRGLTTGAQYQKLDTISIDGVRPFTMQVGGTAVTPAPEHLILAVNGVIQEPNVGFTLSGSTCTLASAIDNDGGSDTIWGMIAGDAAYAAVTALNNATANELVTVGSTTTELDAEANLTYDGTTFGVDDAAVFNESGNDNDFRVEGVGQANALFVQGSDGNVGIGTASPDYPLKIVHGANNYAINTTNSAAAGALYGIALGFSGQAPNDTTSKWINCHDGTHRFVVYSDGDVYTATGTDILQYTSDQRMKENIDDYTGGLSIVNDLRPVTYTWKEGKDMGNPGTHYGFIAQEIEAISEVTGGMNLFSIRELEEDSDDRDLCTDGLMHTTQLSAKEAIFISAIQELSAKVEALENA